MFETAGGWVGVGGYYFAFHALSVRPPVRVFVSKILKQSHLVNIFVIY